MAPPGKLALLVQLGGGIMAVVILSLYFLVSLIKQARPEFKFYSPKTLTLLVLSPNDLPSHIMNYRVPHGVLGFWGFGVLCHRVIWSS